MVTEPTIGMLATTVGVSAIIFIVMSILRSVFTEPTFDRFAPLIAVVIGVVLAEIYVIVTPPVTGSTLVEGALIGLFAGALSQNINTVVTRATKP